MRPKHAAALIAIGALALFGAGCSGDTDEATEVGAHAATLNAHGKADNGPAYTYFEYWRPDNPFVDRLKTQTREWPAGAEGSFSEHTQYLSEQSGYAYRLCGNDQGKEPICASTKYFTTGRAVSTVAVDGSGVAQFMSEPGVNNALTLSAAVPDLDPSITAFKDSSHITVGAGCFEIPSSGGGFVVWCGPLDAVNIKVGDLDDNVSARPEAVVTVDGGRGDDTLETYSYADTLTGGPGQDVMRANDGNDTINARSANLLDPDTDKLIDCGRGNDSVIADRSDPISAGKNGCEHVYKP